nr:hypothetical protein [Rhodococcus wratislaviensis]GLK33467.1 hypothetical protein GCM10017611_03090 [Rhodococcus wratislaviensis]
MSPSDGDPVGMLEWQESVALAAMQVSLMCSDLAATKSGKTVALKEAVLGNAVAGFRQVASADQSDRPDWLTALLGDMDTQETVADAIATQGRRLPPALRLAGAVVAGAGRPHPVRPVADESLLDTPPPAAQTSRRSWTSSRTWTGPTWTACGTSTHFCSDGCSVRVHWGKVAVIGAAGLAAGVATGGWAAPEIGAAIGSAAGLTGAAATSAGLAPSAAARSPPAVSASPAAPPW